MNRQPNSSPRPSTIEIGKQAENRAERFLLTKGLQLICRNYRCRWGEIDLIMKDKDELVFVEVRFRKYNAYGGALESIDYFKQKRLSGQPNIMYKSFIMTQTSLFAALTWLQLKVKHCIGLTI